MSGGGAPSLDVAGEGLTVEIVASQWHTPVMDGLVAGAIRAADAAGAQYRVTRVPGAFELTVAAEQLARGGAQAIAAVGVVIRVGTPHFEYVAGGCNAALGNLQLEFETPIANGVLTVNSIEQAIERAGTKAGNKGAEAAMAAMEMVSLLRCFGDDDDDDQHTEDQA